MRREFDDLHQPAEWEILRFAGPPDAADRDVAHGGGGYRPSV